MREVWIFQLTHVPGSMGIPHLPRWWPLLRGGLNLRPRKETCKWHRHMQLPSPQLWSPRLRGHRHGSWEHIVHERVQDMPLWHKNYFELKACKFLKFLICLKAETSKRTRLSSIPSLGAIPILRLGLKSRYYTQQDLVTNLLYLPSIVLRAHLSFQKVIWLP